MGQTEQSPGIATIFVSNSWIRACALKKETNMATNEQSGSATIYQFPPRGRFAARQEAVTSQQATLAARAVVGGAWYHDEAIETEILRKSS